MVPRSIVPTLAAAVLSLGACLDSADDGPASQAVITPDAPGLADRMSGARVQQPEAVSDLADLSPRAVPVLDPVAPGRASNSVCANALPLTEGTLGAQDLSLGAPPPVGSCFGITQTTLFYAVTIPARSAYFVRVDSEGDDETLSLYGVTTCEPPATGSCTFLDTSLPGDALRLVNIGDAPRRAVFTVVPPVDAPLPRFSLTVEREDLDANAVCAGATLLALDETVTDVVSDLGGPLDPEACPNHRSHFYRVTVPARTRVTANVMSDAHVYPRFLADGCDDFVGCYGEDSFANLGDAPREVVLAMSQVTWDEGLFSLSLSTAPVAPNASCETAAPLPLGTAVTADTRQGGLNDGCAACYGRLALFYTVEVPAGAEVDVTATPEAVTDGRWSGGFVTSATACDTWDCGFPTGFGEDGSSTLRLDNSAGDEAQSYVLTAGRSLWGGEEDPDAGVFTLEAHVVE